MRFFAASLSASILPRRLIEPVLSRTSAISIAMMPRGTSARASRSTILRPRKPPKIVGSVAAASTAMRSGLCVTLKRVTAMPPSGRNAASKTSRASCVRSRRPSSSAFRPAASAAPSTADWRSACTRVLREYSIAAPETTRSGTSATANRIEIEPRRSRANVLNMGRASSTTRRVSRKSFRSG